MAEVQAFQALRYDVGQVGDLSDVVAPPYDVIDGPFQNELYKAHPCNCIRLILNRDEPEDAGVEDRYARAAKFFKQWQQDGVLIREHENALYVYHQEFEWEGTKYVRKGFLGRLKLEEFGKGNVFPHEQTMPGPKKDRLALMTACEANLSPIFGLYPDKENETQNILEDAALSLTPLVATDHLGVVHRMWPVTDPTAIARVQAILADKPIFIADGHHRYETSCNYRNGLAEAGQLNDTSAANCTLMMFCGMEDPGLAILPTHRMVSGFPELSSDDIKAALGCHFRIEEVDNAEAAWESMEMDGGQEVFGIGTPSDGKWLLLQATDTSPMIELAPEQSDVWRGLGVSILHRLIVDHLLKGKHPEADPNFKFVHLMDEVHSGMSEKSCQLAILVMPAGIDHVQAISEELERMPPKSTFFYPKLLSGLVFNSLS
ncbi:MAG: DUF1015 domain-containing protein [Planctomycetota bacterium]|nr:DUF1015 domain-containing protein [Planctomycetota bacterium]